MASSFEAFRRRLESAFAVRGARAEFIRQSGLAQAVLQRWLNSESEPNLSSVDRAAAALGYKSAWEMLRPDTPERSLGERIDELKAAVTAPALSQAEQELLSLFAGLGPDEAEHILATLRAIHRRKLSAQRKKLSDERG